MRRVIGFGFPITFVTADELSLVTCPDAARWDAERALARATERGFAYCEAVFIERPDGVIYDGLAEKAHPTDAWLDWGRGQRITERYFFRDGKLVPDPAATGVAMVLYDDRTGTRARQLRWAKEDLAIQASLTPEILDSIACAFEDGVLRVLLRHLRVGAFGVENSAPAAHLLNVHASYTTLREYIERQGASPIIAASVAMRRMSWRREAMPDGWRLGEDGWL